MISRCTCLFHPTQVRSPPWTFLRLRFKSNWTLAKRATQAALMWTFRSCTCFSAKHVCTNHSKIWAWQGTWSTNATTTQRSIKISWFASGSHYSNSLQPASVWLDHRNPIQPGWTQSLAALACHDNRWPTWWPTWWPLSHRSSFWSRSDSNHLPIPPLLVKQLSLPVDVRLEMR